MPISLGSSPILGPPESRPPAPLLPQPAAGNVQATSRARTARKRWMMWEPCIDCPCRAKEWSQASLKRIESARAIAEQIDRRFHAVEHRQIQVIERRLFFITNVAPRLNRVAA